jgi:Fe-S cluster biogenesis protein NfuA
MPDTQGAAADFDARKRGLIERVEAVLDAHVRPNLRADGGNVELVDIDADHVVQVRFQGACQGCPSASLVMAMSIESKLKAHVPEIRFLETVA